MEIVGFGGDPDGVAGIFLVGRPDKRELAVRLQRDEQQAVRVRRQLQLVLAAEVEQRLGERRLLQGLIAGPVVDDLDPLLGRIEQALERRHDRICGKHARIPEMGIMPFVAVFEPDPRQVRPDPPGAEQMRHVERVFAGLAHGTPAARLAGHRTNVLGMAVPAAVAQVHAPPALLQRRVVGGLGRHPFELAQIGAHHRGYVGGSRRWFDQGQDALGENGEKEEKDAGDQSHKARSHSAGPPAGIGFIPLRIGSLASLGRVSAVIIKLITSRDMPISMLMPDNVRTTQ